MSKLKEKAKIVSTETGEIIGTIHEGDRILKKNSIDRLIKLEDYEEWKIENFFKGNVQEVKKWIKELSGNEKIFLFSIAPFISYEDCHIQDEYGNDIGTEGLIELTGMSHGSLYETIKTLRQKDIIYKGENSKIKQYFVNPWLFCKGKRINKVLKTMFKNYKIKILNNTAWKDLKNYNESGE